MADKANVRERRTRFPMTTFDSYFSSLIFIPFERFLVKHVPEVPFDFALPMTCAEANTALVTYVKNA